MKNDGWKNEWIRVHTAQLEELRKLAWEAKQDADLAWASAQQHKLEAEQHRKEFENLIVNSKYVRIQDEHGIPAVIDFDDYLKNARNQAAQQNAYLRLPWWKKFFVAEPRWK